MLTLCKFTTRTLCAFLLGVQVVFLLTLCGFAQTPTLRPQEKLLSSQLRQVEGNHENALLDATVDRAQEMARYQAAFKTIYLPKALKLQALLLKQIPAPPSPPKLPALTG